MTTEHAELPPRSTKAQGLAWLSLGLVILVAVVGTNIWFTDDLANTLGSLDLTNLASMGGGLLAVWFGGDLLLYIAGSIVRRIYGEAFPPWLKVIGPTWKDVGIVSKASVTVLLLAILVAVMSGNWWMFPVIAIGSPLSYAIAMSTMLSSESE